MNLKNKIEQISMYSLATISVLISITDFLGFLDAFPWLSQRISIMTLLAIGLIALYLVTQRGQFSKETAQRVRMMEYTDGYVELRTKIRDAKKSILILTEYVNIFDWEKKEPLWHPERKNSQKRKTFFASLQKKLKREKNNRNFKFAQIIQIPENHKLEEMLLYDPILANNCEFIVKLAKDEPEFASLRVSRMTFGNSIILIDDEFTHISFDIRKPGAEFVLAPFVLIVEDKSSKAIQFLRKLFSRIESNSTLVTRIY